MRNLGLDLLKIFSCIGVVTLHSTMSGFNLEQYNISAYLYYLGTYAIPLFFMLNGYFLLNKKILSYRYVLNKIVGILTVVSAWNILIWLIRWDFNVNLLRKIIGSLVQKGYFYQFWFFGSLIIIYLTLPIIKKVLEKDYSYSVVLLFLMVIGIIIEIINTHEVKLTKFSKLIFSLLFIISPILLFYLAKNVYHSILAEYFYDSIIVKLISVVIFIIFIRIGKSITLKNNELIIMLSSLTMGVYIVHTYILAQVMKYIDTSVGYNTIFILIITLSISFFISRIIWSIKYFRVLLKI